MRPETIKLLKGVHCLEVVLAVYFWVCPQAGAIKQLTDQPKGFYTEKETITGTKRQPNE